MSQLAVESTPPVVAPGVLGNPPATDVGAAAAFAVAIQLALGVGRPGLPGAAQPGSAQPGSTQRANPDRVGEADEATTGDAASTAALAAGLVAGAPLPLPLPVPAATAADTDAGKGGKGEPGGQAVAATTTGAGSPTAAPLTQPAASTTTREAAPTSGETSVRTVAVAGTTRPAHGPRPDVPADQREQAPPTGTAPTSPAQPVAADAPATASAPAATTPSPVAARAVATQVVPEVTRLFSNGEGVHRVTLELNPKALGEVRVVLTVRNGDVHVRLAAGTEARQALAHSSADLTRALEHIGVKDHRLTLAELPGVAASAGSQTFSDTADQRDQGAAFTGRFDAEQHHDSRQPRMGDGSTATDGTDQEHGTRSRGDRSVHEVSHVPSRGGVDLRM